MAATLNPSPHLGSSKWKDLVEVAKTAGMTDRRTLFGKVSFQLVSPAPLLVLEAPEGSFVFGTSHLPGGSIGGALGHFWCLKKGT